MWKIHSNMFFRIYTSLNQLMCLCKNFERIKEFFGHVNDFSWRDETYFPKKIQTKKWHQTPRHYLRSKRKKVGNISLFVFCLFLCHKNLCEKSIEKETRKKTKRESSDAPLIWCKSSAKAIIP